MAQVNFRIDDKVKQEADELFDNLGVSLSAAITIFIKRSISRRGFPFPIVEEPANGSAGFYPYERTARAPVVERTQPLDPVVLKRIKKRDEMMKFAGCWKDDRTTEEIIKDIEGHRTKGREVNL